MPVNEIIFEPEEYQALFSEYRDDLQNYIKTLEVTPKETLRYMRRYLLNLLTDKWQTQLGFDIRDIKNDIEEIQVPDLTVSRIWTLKEAVSHYEANANRWLIPNFLRSSGLYILGGAPKTGKSLLTYFLVKSVATGSSFLGYPTQVGKVLHIQLEESIDTVSDRLVMTGFTDYTDSMNSLLTNYCDNFQIEDSLDLGTQIGYLIKRIADFKPSLVVIDSLRMATSNSGTDENTNSIGRLMYRLSRVANYLGVCIVVVHHMNKSGASSKETSLVEAMAGHNSISAATDGLIGLRSENLPSGGTSIYLNTLPRHGVPIAVRYKLKSNPSGLLTLEKLWEDVAANQYYTSRILQFLALNNTRRFTAEEICAGCLGDYVPYSEEFQTAINYLRNLQLIQASIYGNVWRYHMANDSDWVVNPRTVYDLVSQPIRDANELTLCETKSQLIKLAHNWTPERRKEAIAAILNTYTKKLELLAKTQIYASGDNVLYKDTLHTVIGTEGNLTMFDTKYKLNNIEECVSEIELVLEN